MALGSGFKILAQALLGLLFGWVLYRCYLWPRLVSPYRRLPGPRDTFFPWGHLFTTFSNPPGQHILNWTRSIPNDGLLVFRSLGRHQLVPTSAATLKAVLNDCAYDWQKPKELSEFLGRILGYGIVLSEGDAHRHQRKQLLPAFHTSVIRKLHPLFWKKGKQLVERLGELEVVELHEWAARATLDIIGVAGFAHDFNSLDGKNSALIDCYKRLLDPRPANVAWFGLGKIFPPWLVRLLMPGKDRELRDDMHQLRAQALEILQKRTNLQEDVDVLSRIIADRALSEENVVDQMLTMLAAGHETTAAALCWIVFLLATNPGTQQTLRHKIRNKISSLDAEVDYYNIESLSFLNAVCNEGLRLYPIAPITVRTAVRDTMIGSQVVRKGTTAMLVPWAINRSEQFWTEPDSFRPDRWMNGQGAPTNYASMTFLHGPRSCLGRDFAQGELKCLVAALVGWYEITLDMKKENVIPVGFFTLKPKNGLRVRLTALPGW